MEPSIYRFIWRHSRVEQIKLVAFTMAAFPFLYLSLELPKQIINEAIGGNVFPVEYFGYELEQLTFLFVLCGLFLSLVLLNGVFKFFINVYRGVVGERMLRRYRYQLYNHVLRFPLPQFRKTSQGEIVSMITAETEPLGGFIGDSIALPVFQGGTMITILFFMFVQDPVLGTAAVALYPLQAYLIPKLQRRVNLLKKERVLHVRKLSERISEVVGGINEVHTHDTSQFELADFSSRIGKIYYIRYQIYLQKFFIKFINNFINQVTPFFFYSIGGYLVIKGELSFGALVAVLAAYKDLSDPWKELLNYYQMKEDARIKYDLLRETFEPKGLMEPEMLSAEPPADLVLRGDMVATNLDLAEEDESETAFAGGLSFRTGLPTSICVVGDASSGKDRLAAIIGGLMRPTAGSLKIGDQELVGAPQSVTGRRIAYIGRAPSLRAGTLMENLLYPLKHRPVRPTVYEGEAAVRHEKEHQDSALAGNSEYDIDDDWVDYPAAGVAGPDEMVERAIEVLDLADLEPDVYELGLQGSLDPERQTHLVERVLEARAELRHRLEDPEIASFLEPFDQDAYITNMTVAENVMFGTPRNPSFSIDSMAENDYVRRVIEEVGLMPDFLRMGREVAELMVNLFADVEPGSELFEQFSFIDAEDLPEFKSILARTDSSNPEAMDAKDRNRLLNLPFKLIPARHRLGMIEPPIQTRLLEARRKFAEGFGSGTPPVDFFDPDHYNPAVSIQDNILFGRLVYGKARSAARIGELIGDVVEKLHLRRSVIEVGLHSQIGIGGSRLSPNQRQKVALARCVLKRPDVLVLDEATGIFDARTQARVHEGLLAEFKGRSLIWLVHHARLCEKLDVTLVLESGKVVEKGTCAELSRPGTAFSLMLES